MIAKTTYITFFLVTASIIFFAGSRAQASQECADRVMATCTKCHYPTRICEKLGKKSRRDWQTTIKRMLRYGLVLTDNEQESVLNCLTTLDDKNGILCK